MRRVPSSVLPAVYTVTLHQQAKLLQGARFDAHMKVGGLKHSNWRVVGIGLACLVAVVLFAALLGLELAFPGTLAE